MKFPIHILLLVAAIAGACADRTPIDPVTALGKIDERPSSGFIAREYAPGYDIDVTVGGALLPDQPVVITARIKSLTGAPSHIRIAAPEIVLAEDAEWAPGAQNSHRQADSSGVNSTA